MNVLEQKPAAAVRAVGSGSWLHRCQLTPLASERSCVDAGLGLRPNQPTAWCSSARKRAHVNVVQPVVSGSTLGNGSLTAEQDACGLRDALISMCGDRAGKTPCAPQNVQLADDADHVAVRVEYRQPVHRHQAASFRLARLQKHVPAGAGMRVLPTNPKCSTKSSQRADALCASACHSI